MQAMSLRFVHIMSLSLVRNSVYFILLLFFSYFRSLISFTMSRFINIMPFPSTCIMCTYHSFGEFACVLCCVISPVPVASIRQAWFAHYARLNQDVWRYLRSVKYISLKYPSLCQRSKQLIFTTFRVKCFIQLIIFQ